MKKILISIPEQLLNRAAVILPARQRSKIIVKLIEQEVVRREQKLYECALAVEQDEKLQHDMSNWDVTTSDGLDDETW